MDDSKKYTHESFGMLQFCRCTGGNTQLFGTTVKHNDKIRMRLRHGEVERHLNHDYYYGRGLIAEVEMSYSQFAEAITAMNIGDGVPVTIRYLNGEEMANCPFVDKRTQFENEFSAKIDKARTATKKLIDDVTALFEEKKNINKGDREEILSKLRAIDMEIGANTKFVYERFNEAMDKTVAEAKGEIELFYQNKVNALASAGLVELGNAPSADYLITEGEDNE